MDSGIKKNPSNLACAYRGGESGLSRAPSEAVAVAAVEAIEPLRCYGAFAGTRRHGRAPWGQDRSVGELGPWNHKRHGSADPPWPPIGVPVGVRLLFDRERRQGKTACLAHPDVLMLVTKG